MNLTQPERLEASSLDIRAEQLGKLRQLFPEVFTEGDRVDFDRLRLTLGDDTLDDTRERFGLTWPGKSAAFRLIQQPSTATLVPAPDESVNFDTTQNLFLEGDNLEVLKLLQKSYLGRVKLIYIDPPYNTGNDFVYPDDFADSLQNYLALTGQTDEAGRRLRTNPETDGRFHSNWLNLMYPRLFLARNLLREDGVIFISIDDNEVHHLRMLCNEIFGEENFVGQFNWFKSATPPNLSLKIKKNIEYILCYEKQKNNNKFKGVKKESKSDDPLTKPQNSIKELVFAPGTISINLENQTIPIGVYGTDKYPNSLLTELIIADGYNKNEVVFANRFVWTQDKLKEEICKGTKISIYSKSLVLSYKKADYDEEVPPNLIDDSVGVSTTESAGNDLKKLFDGLIAFDYPKPESLIKYLINCCCNADSLILDFFSGSGTTAHAVLELNKDGGNRRFICVQLPEPIDEGTEAYKAGYRTIADIGKERIRRVIKKLNAQRAEATAKAAASPELFTDTPPPITHWDSGCLSWPLRVFGPGTVASRKRRRPLRPPFNRPKPASATAMSNKGCSLKSY